MTNSDFDAMRREAEISSTELADYMGASRRFMLQVETGREPVTPGMVACLKAMMADRK